MKRTVVLLALLSALVIGVGGANASTPSPFFNGFETDTSGWLGNITRVASGTNGVTSATDSYHAEVADSSVLTRWGGYTNTFPVGGYSTSVDIYLNVDGGYANDTRFDWDSSVSDTSGNFRRDFIFNCGYYNDSDVTGTGPRFVCSASNNSSPGSAYPKNPGRDPYSITTGGWYTFVHHFYDSGGGVLAVDLSIKDSSGNVLHTWTLSDSTDIIGSTVGGNRYGWFDDQAFPFLAIDNSGLTVPTVCTTTGFVRDGIDLTAAYIDPASLPPTVDATGCNIGVYYGPGTTGTVSSVDISGANYY